MRISDNKIQFIIMYVSRETCWVRLVDDRYVNCGEEEWRGSRCMLKLPVIMNSCQVVAAEDRTVWNSSRKRH